MPAHEITAILWDYGGVVTTSPFDAFNRFEAANGLPMNFIRNVNTRNIHGNAWAKMERNEVDLDGFCALFEEESRAAGHMVKGRDVLTLIYGDIRHEIVAAIERLSRHYRQACLTNNMTFAPINAEKRKQSNEIMALFDYVFESSKVGIRKPQTEFYQLACRTMGITPNEAVFLDDLGVNLRPARDMGMQTIKVTSGHQALDALASVLGHAP